MAMRRWWPNLAQATSSSIARQNRSRISGDPTGESRYNVSGSSSKFFLAASPSSPPTRSSPKRSIYQRAEQQRERGEKMWKEAGESEDAYTESLRVISEAEAKISSATEVAKTH